MEIRNQNEHENQIRTAIRIIKGHIPGTLENQKRKVLKYIKKLT